MISVVNIKIKGVDISPAIRPLVQSFFGNITYNYEYIEDEEEESAGESAESAKVSGSGAGRSKKAPAEPVSEGDSLDVYCEFERDTASCKIFLNGELKEDGREEDMPIAISEYRYKAGRLVYDLLKNVTGKELPWGILVGIRPTKHVYEALEQGRDLDSIRDEMSGKFYVSDSRIETAIRIANCERKILGSFDYKKGYSIYIGIPFCPSTCLYCSFASYPVEQFGHLMDDYLTSLERELAYASMCMPLKNLNTIYVGGGTPTALSEEGLERLLRMIHRYLPVEKCLEFSVEAGRPDSVNEAKLKLLKDYGVTRISINPQTFVQRTLDLIGRKHDVDSVLRAYEAARNAGHDNINMDLIVGLTGETPKDVEETLKYVEKLSPESLTVHTLAIKRAARLKIENETYRGMAATGIPEMIEMTMEYAREHRYHPYYLYRQKNMAENLENTGYAKPGKEGLYNILIMEEKQPIIALGAGATTKMVYNNGDILRVENVKSLPDYIGRVDEMIERKRTITG